MPYRFIFFTWLIIIPVNIIFIALAMTMNKWAESGSVLHVNVLLEVVLMVGIFSLPFATPGLFGLMILCWIAEEFIDQLRTRYRFILAGSSIITALCYLLLELVLDLNLQINEYTLLVTASILSVCFALWITRRIYYSFYESQASGKYFSISSLETDKN